MRLRCVSTVLALVSFVATAAAGAGCSSASPPAADPDELGGAEDDDKGDGAGELGDTPSDDEDGNAGTGQDGASPTPGDETPLALEVQRSLIGAGADATCAVTTAGALKCWGRNDRGQLGLGDTRNRTSPSGPLNLGGGRTAVSVAVGWYHACALASDGAVLCWGQNDGGQLGQGNTQNRSTPQVVPLGNAGHRVVAVTAGGYHACALFEDGALKCWGANGYGQLGVGDTAHRGDGANEMEDKLPFVSLGTGRKVLSVAAGNFHTCAVLDDGSLKCWGAAANGQIGLGYNVSAGTQPGHMGDGLPAVQLGAGRRALSVTCGGFHSCVVLDGGDVKCFGANDTGQQGLGDTRTRGNAQGQMGDALAVTNLGGGKVAAQLGATYDHTCARFGDGSVKCWGWNKGGQLGLGDVQTRGDGAGEMGDTLEAVELGAAAIAIGVGWDHSCALFDGDKVKCWGVNGAGQLGIGTTQGRTSPPRSPTAL